jgi:arylsulfatase A-like enzyme
MALEILFFTDRFHLLVLYRLMEMRVMKKLIAALFFTSVLALPLHAGERPNVIVILTDDQGFGDLSFTGNAVLKTPHIDALGKDGVWLKNFYVSPVCSPTRSSLLTGRYNYRTGIVDTYIGRSMMHADEVTLAETLRANGYRTGIFGKWHLGDNYPLRAMDQGFEEALVLRGGGIGQPSDPPGGERYHDPILSHNGVLKKMKGYCSDVYTSHAMEFIEKHRAEPFFVYLPFNAPHGPLETPEKEYKDYKNADPDKNQPALGQRSRKTDEDAARKVYAMVANVDNNIGRLMAKLKALNLDEKTIVVFFTDNGPQQPRYNGGLRGLKTSVYDGGLRVPCFVRWPGTLKAGTEISERAAHIDLAPTLLEACGVERAGNVKIDGRSLWPLLTGRAPSLPPRSLFFQWHRGDVPEALRAFAVVTPEWKLVQAAGVQADVAFAHKYELFKLSEDPYEQHDLAAQNPEIVSRLKADYEAWFADVKSSREFAKPRIHIGTPHEAVTVLTKQEWRGPRASWGSDGLGHWDAVVERGGDYRVTVYFTQNSGTVAASIGGVHAEQRIEGGDSSITFELKNVPTGETRVETWVEQGDKKIGTKHVHVELKR